MNNIYSHVTTIERLKLNLEGPYFETVDSNLLFHDDLCTETGILGKRLVEEDLFYPFLYVRNISTGNSGGLVFIVRDKPEILYIWNLNEKHHKINDFWAPISDVLFLLACLDPIPLAELNESGHSPAWADSCISTILSNLSSFSSSKEAACSLREIPANLAELFIPQFTSKVNSSYHQLLEDAKYLLDKVKFEIFADYCQRYEASIGTNPPSWIDNSTYCILRELFAVVSSQHIILDPFTGRHIVSSAGKVCRLKNDCWSSRHILYTSPLGHSFIERRGPAWLDVSSEIIFDSGHYLKIRSGQQWGEMDGDEKQAIVEFLSQASNNINCIRSSNGLAIYIDADGRNLGHIIWNELSGYYEFLDLVLHGRWKPDFIALIMPPQLPSNFSGTSLREQLYGRTHRLLEQAILGIESSSKVKIVKYDFFLNQDIIPSLLPVSFRYPKVSHAVKEALQSYNQPKGNASHGQAGINILINLRLHNKAHLNVIDCLDHFLAALSALRGDSFMNTVAVHLEYSTIKDALETEVLNDLQLLLKRHSVSCYLHANYDANKLFELISQANICVVPIGSGAVIPTWIFSKPTVLHGDTGHMQQLSFWGYIAGSDSHLFPVPEAAIIDRSETYYSDYEIEATSFTRALLRALAYAERSSLAVIE